MYAKWNSREKYWTLSSNGNTLHLGYHCNYTDKICYLTYGQGLQLLMQDSIRYSDWSWKCIRNFN